MAPPKGTGLRGCKKAGAKGTRRLKLTHSRTWSKKIIRRMPQDIIQNILSFLPVQKAYAISACSRSFRNAWRLCRDLPFDEDFSKSVPCDQLKAIIHKFVMGHSGLGARRFHLYFDPQGDVSIISNWVGRAVTLGFEEINLDFSLHKKPIILRDGILFSGKLRILDLTRCDPNLPLSPSNTLPYLQAFTLRDMMLTQKLIDSVFASCSSLRSLNLVSCCSSASIVFNAHSLERLKEILFQSCDGKLCDCRIDAPFIDCIRFHHSLGTNVNLQIGLPPLNDTILRKHFITRDLKIISHRSTKYFALRDFAMMIYPRPRWPVWRCSLWNVEEFHLNVQPDCCIDLCYIPIFLYRCPMIKRVFVDVGEKSLVKSMREKVRVRKTKKTREEWVKEVMKLPLKFERLNSVKISGVRSEYNDEYMMFMEFFLVKSTSELRDIILIKAEGHNFCIDSPEWSRLKELSSSASIRSY